MASPPLYVCRGANSSSDCNCRNLRMDKEIFKHTSSSRLETRRTQLQACVCSGIPRRAAPIPAVAKPKPAIGTAEREYITNDKTEINSVRIEIDFTSLQYQFKLCIKIITYWQLLKLIKVIYSKKEYITNDKMFNSKSNI